jgi:hypothetical protein
LRPVPTLERGGAGCVELEDVQEIKELKRQRLTIRAISQLIGYDRKTISKYFVHPEGVPV